jgi:catechol 2,3-dioxygenase-like lactoylglutathione lyase family enzyme
MTARWIRPGANRARSFSFHSATAADPPCYHQTLEDGFVVGALDGPSCVARDQRVWVQGDYISDTECALITNRNTGYRDRMTIQRMDNVGIVVDDLAATIAFFRELGLELEGRGMVEGEWAGRVTGLGHQRVEIAMMRTPDGHSRLELSRFLAPPVVADHRKAPVNALGYLRVMFTVDDIDETLARLRKHGAELVSSEVVQYEDSYRLCYIRGPEGLLIGLAQEMG